MAKRVPLDVGNSSLKSRVRRSETWRPPKDMDVTHTPTNAEMHDGDPNTIETIAHPSAAAGLWTKLHLLAV